MAFTSATFFFFHLLVVLLRWTLPRRVVGPLLVIASYAFYLSWGARYGLLIGSLTLLGWGSGRLLDRFGDPRARRVVLTFTVSVLLGTLAYFKYANFAITCWRSPPCSRPRRAFRASTCCSRSASRSTRSRS
jgi:hypothetical protein